MSASFAMMTAADNIRMPLELQKSLGLQPELRVAVSALEGRLVAESVAGDDHADVDALFGILSSEVDLVAEGQQERQQDK